MAKIINYLSSYKFSSNEENSETIFKWQQKKIISKKSAPEDDNIEDEKVGKHIFSVGNMFLKFFFGHKDKIEEQIKHQINISKIDPEGIFTIGKKWSIANPNEFRKRFDSQENFLATCEGDEHFYTAIIQNYLGKSLSEIKSIDLEIIEKASWSLFYGLDLMYSNKLFHGDITLNNIVLSDDLKKIYLIDWEFKYNNETDWEENEDPEDASVIAQLLIELEEETIKGKKYSKRYKNFLEKLFCGDISSDFYQKYLSLNSK